MLSRITLFTAVLAICGGLFTVGGIVVPIKDAHAGKYGDKDKKCPKPARYRTKDGKCVASGVKKRAGIKAYKAKTLPGKYGNKDKKCPKPARYRTKDGKCVASGVRKRAGIKAYKARTLALQKKAPEFTFAKQLPIFRGYEDCMIRTFYAIGGNDWPLTKFMNKAQLSNYHNKCFSDVLNGEGDSKYEVEYSKYGLAITTGNAPITDALVRKQLDFLRCDYVRNRNIAQYNMSMGGELQYRICRKINYVKGTAVSFAD
tara:strand:+ start:119 stop:892 length:774 start_codon:yes stop_codon:yes gene_type:complete